ncbi:hypothetical protein E8F11_21430 [Pseudomonas sp. BN417]|nr:hypothetical protein [Pseudomonas sp. BN417]
MTPLIHRPPAGGDSFASSAFRLGYAAAKVQPNHRYAVSARIELDGKLMFISTEQHSVKLDGSDPQPLRIKVDPVR